MFSVDQIPDAQWPLFHTGALLDAQAWLQSLQRVEGADAVQEDGHSRWRLSPRIGARYFGVLEMDTGEKVWLAQHPEWMEEYREGKGEKLEVWMAALPLSWFALTPWKARWILPAAALQFPRLALQAIPVNDKRSPQFTVEIPVARQVYDYLQSSPISSIRTAIGNPVQIPLMGFHFQQGD